LFCPPTPVEPRLAKARPSTLKSFTVPDYEYANPSPTSMHQSHPHVFM
jgi:hypothetical protein